MGILDDLAAKWYKRHELVLYNFIIKILFNKN